METSELIEEIENKLKSLRFCSTQALAVQWMADTYKLLEASLPYLKDEAPKVAIFLPRPLKLVQFVGRDFFLNPAPLKTVVYPEFKMPAVAWTKKDTICLEKARLQSS